MPRLVFSGPVMQTSANVRREVLRKGLPLVTFSGIPLPPDGPLPTCPPTGTASVRVSAMVATCCRQTVFRHSTWQAMGVRPAGPPLTMTKTCGGSVGGRIGRVWIEVAPNMTVLPGIAFAPQVFPLAVICANEGDIPSDLVGLDWLHHAIIALSLHSTDVTFPVTPGITVI